MPTCAACGQENPAEARFCLACGTPLAPAEVPREQRKTVTVVFADVVSSTELGDRHDPEAVRRVMARYFEEARPVLERHGATVEKFIGDAVMAVFGIPVVHEDDALRAVRAAVELRDGLAAVNEELRGEWGISLAIRTGVNTGEVVAGGGETLVTGDAVNVAARLEQAAAPGEVLIGDRTYQLVAGAVDAEPAGPLELKGKAEGVVAYRVERVIQGAEPYARRLDAPMVGRKHELAQLRTAYDRAVRERGAHLFTVLGAAGIGKSRLVQEFLAGVDGEATVLSGRCLPYGEGITYWPLVAMFREAAQDDARGRLLELLEGEQEAELIAGRVAAAIGSSGGASSSDETAWAFRRLFEQLARERPLVALFDDLQWAEPTLLDLIEHVADLSRDAPILLLCVARPDLLDERPAWSGGMLNATSILLEPLSDSETSALMEELLSGAGVSEETKRRIADAAEGNPLFVEQMLAMVSENGAGEISVPPTIHALLAARLDRLPSPERAVIDRASVVGKEFWRGAVAEMAPEEVRAAVAGHLTALVRKELIRPGRSFLPGEDAFRFRHLLIRDAAYDAMPKELRAALHERFAGWLDAQSDGRLVEVDEITGYHLEQAYRYRAELGPIDEEARVLATRAGRRLVSAGRRAFARADMPAAATLLQRAAALLEPHDPERLEMLPELVETTGEVGDLAAARDYVDEALAVTENLADQRLRAYVTLANLEWRLFAESVAARDHFPTVERLIHVLEASGDDTGLARAWRLLSQLHLTEGQAEAMGRALEHAIEHARRAGDGRIEQNSLGWLAVSLFHGPVPVDEARARVAEIVEGALGAAQAFALNSLAGLEAFLGHFNDAFELLEKAEAGLRDLGLVLLAAGAGNARGNVALLAGDPARAERELRASISELGEAGERGVLSTNAALLAHALCAQGRHAEAEEYVRMSAETAAPDDAASQIIWRTALAKIRANHGSHGEADELVRAALRLAEGTDFTTEHAAVLVTQADVLAAAGRASEAEAPLREALALYEQKGDVVSAGRVRAQLADLAG